MAKVLAINATDSAEAFTKGERGFVGDDGDRFRALLCGELNGHGTEAAPAAPDEDDVVLADSVFLPAEEHAVRSGPHQRRCGGGFPREVLRLGHAHVTLDARELGERAPVRLVAPDLERRVVHRVFAGEHAGGVHVPLAAMRNDLVADLHVRDSAPDGVNDARRVGSADMEVLRLATLHAGSDHIDGAAEPSPNVVVVHARGHHINEDIVRPEFGGIHDFAREGARGLAKARLADELRVHPRGHAAKRRSFAEFVQFLRSGRGGHSWPPWRGWTFRVSRTTVKPV